VIKDDFPKLSTTAKQRCVTAINERLALAPESYGKPLRHNLSGFWSLRTGDYRILYSMDKEANLVTIIRIDHRKDVYE
jgi:mRNA interferase RelE/StbE